MTSQSTEPSEELRRLLRRIEELVSDEPAPTKVALRPGGRGIAEAPPPGMPTADAAAPSPGPRRALAVPLLLGTVALAAGLAASWSLLFEWPGLSGDDAVVTTLARPQARRENPPSAPAGIDTLPIIQAGRVREASAQAGPPHDPPKPAPTARLAMSAAAAPSVPNATVAAPAGTEAVDAAARASSPPTVALGDSGRLDDASQDRLLIQGLRQVVLGNVNSARLLFTRAAESGNARAALILGDTFEETRLVQFGVLGVQPDRDKAVYWYERADELGAPEAKERLSELNAR